MGIAHRRRYRGGFLFGSKSQRDRSPLFELARVLVRFDHIARGIIKRVLRDPDRGPGLIVKGKRISCPPHYDYEHGFPLIRSLQASTQRSTSVLFSFALSLLIVAGSFAIRQSKTRPERSCAAWRSDAESGNEVVTAKRTRGEGISFLKAGTVYFDDCVLMTSERFELYKRPCVNILNPSMRRKITHVTWEQIKTGYAAGINLREIARKMHIPPGTVLAHAKRHGWTQQIQVATRQLAVVQSDAITPVQSVPQSIASILNERKDRTRLGLSQYAAEAAERAAESDGDLALARNVRDVAAVHSTLWPETPQPGILQVGVLIGTEQPRPVERKDEPPV